MRPMLRWRTRLSTAGFVAICAVGGVAGQAPTDWPTYVDPEGRFTFAYPQSFGSPGPGTDDGFGQRVAAVRFERLRGLGGEAVLTTGPVQLDVQALGGLYDAITLQVLPADARASVVAQLPAVTLESFCGLLGRESHLPPTISLAEPVLAAARMLDHTRNIDPVVARCVRDGTTIVFHKEATIELGAASARQHVYGAIRFLSTRYSSFQVVRAATTAPSAAAVDTLGLLVRSFTER